MRFSELSERRFGQRDLAQAPTFSSKVTLGFEFEVEYHEEVEDWQLDQHVGYVIENSDDAVDAFSQLFDDGLPRLADGYVYCEEDGEETLDASWFIKDEDDNIVDLRDGGMYDEIEYEKFIKFFDSSRGYNEHVKDSYKESNRSHDRSAVQEVEDILESEGFERMKFNVVSDESLTYGAEIVTSPLSPETAWEDFDDLMDLISDHPSLYTTNDCGLHVNIGTFGIDNFDILKFMMFFDEGYINKVFPVRNLTSKLGRVLMKLLDASGTPGDYREFNTALLKKLNGDRYYSVNFSYLTDKNYIEVRAPGGEGYETRGQDIRDLVSRVYRCIELAMDKSAYRKEYIKKLSKFTDTNGKDDKPQGDINSRYADLVKSWTGRSTGVKVNGINDFIYIIYSVADNSNTDIPIKLIPSFRSLAAEVAKTKGVGPAYGALSKNQFKKLAMKIRQYPKAVGLMGSLVNQYITQTEDNTRHDI